MSTTASPAAVPRTPPASTMRRNQSYADRDKYQTTTSRPATASSPRRSLSQSGTPAHSRTNSNHAQLANVQRRDFEQTDLANTPPNTTPAESRPPSDHPSRSDSTRQPTDRTATGQHSRYNSQDMAPAAQPPANGNANPTTHHTTSSGVRRRTTIDASTGLWELGKTIGAGSMGKVKLARNKDTNEQVRLSPTAWLC